LHQIINKSEATNEETTNQNQRRASETKKALELYQNSPQNNRSLHNHPPRKIRNIIPETPTQNMPALPQNSAPLIRQHRRHSCNLKKKKKKINQKSKLQPRASN
jgi:hypothetical protein